MAARTLQPSEYEIQREVEALRDLRRRSTTPGALTIDPDLPNQSPPSSPTANYWSPIPKSPILTDNDFVSSPQDASSSSNHAADSSHTSDSVNPNNPADDPFHLFWVPASLHPEIAPAEFRAFLKEHARNPPSTDGSDSLDRSPSLSSRSSLSRQRSMLSRQYSPREGDGVEEENIVPLRRNRSFAQNRGPQLTINDLQKLEELAEEASENDDPSKLRSVLRRSLSLNLSPTAIDLMDDMPEMGDEADAPIIVPPPGQILRRAARTKIRKPGLPGDGGGHRFGSSRRVTRTSAEQRTSGEMSSNENGELEASPSRRLTLSDDGLSNQRPDSFSEETSIFDAYAQDEEDEVNSFPIAITPSTVLEASPPPFQHHPPARSPQLGVQPSLLEALAPVLHQPQPQRLLVSQPVSDSQGQPSRSPSPIESVQETSSPSPSLYSPPPSQPTLSSIQAQQPPQRKEKEKDKKFLFGKWGGDKGGKKGGKERGQENRDRVGSDKEKEKEGFFGSLFGGKKKQEDYQSPITGGASGREAAQALLGVSKSSKSYVPPTSPGLAPGSPNFARYPIHVERAIYRLSHIKLANPRRPLYEQVLISNLMFWYLGVINKAQMPASQTPTDATSIPTPTGSEMEEREKEQKEREQSEKAEKERLERENIEKEQRDREREVEMKKKESGRKGSLTKQPVGGPVGSRRAEMPIKGPQYEMQHRVMEKEYGGYNSQPQPNRPPNSPVLVNGGNAQPFPRSPPPAQIQQYPNSPPKLVQPQMKPQAADNYYYQPDKQRSGLPPGAMAPVGMSPSGSSPPMHKQPPPTAQQTYVGPHRHSRSPPPQNSVLQQPQPQLPRTLYQLNTSQESLGNNMEPRSPSRSLSATAVASPGNPPVNGNLRKGHSAHAVTSYDNNRRPRVTEGKKVPNGFGEEEDLPLAVWQQQQRK